MNLGGGRGRPGAAGDAASAASVPATAHGSTSTQCRRPARLRRLAITGLGVALVWGALGALGYVWGWQVHAHRAADALVRAERRAGLPAAQPSSAVPATTPSTSGSRSCVVTAASTGDLAGLLVIPAVHLTAPVEEGTSDTVLGVAVGHDPSSVWPGEAGTAALLAHDVSYFVHLGTLKAGDTIDYETPCSTVTFVVSKTEVVEQGTALPDTGSSSLVLDTCYPSNALFFTSQRLLVWARETSGHTSPAAGAVQQQGAAPGDGATSSITVPPSDHVTYRVPAPPALVGEGLTLQQNEAPMGTMTLTGQTSPSWAQSPGPMALEAAALEAYFGGLHAATATQGGWWADIAEPSVAMPTALRGATVTGHNSPLDVAIASTRQVASSVVLTSEVTLAGGPAPGIYDETVTAVVHGTTVLLGGWTLRPA